ncbi:hypothetical protein FA13DRAFT_1717322 [Coprinellus micaceus]|uniref:Uncharacterized protein n=1 Tax=Coprinellus micaceus TaxID=71717 RepID=A0A4Y7SH53_COPMI|nr:hypothetical protein FA13DRAFT_1717322 [Coprinellus micaceus]
MYTAGTKHVNPVGTPHRKRGDVLNNIHILLPVAEAIICMPTLDMGGAWVIQTRARISIGVHGYPCTQYNSPYMWVDVHGTHAHGTYKTHGYMGTHVGHVTACSEDGTVWFAQRHSTAASHRVDSHAVGSYPYWLYLSKHIDDVRVCGLVKGALPMGRRSHNSPLVNRRCTRRGTALTVPQEAEPLYLSTHIGDNRVDDAHLLGQLTACQSTVYSGRYSCHCASSSVSAIAQDTALAVPQVVQELYLSRPIADVPLYLSEYFADGHVCGLVRETPSIETRSRKSPHVNRRSSRTDRADTVPQAVYQLYLSKPIVDMHAWGLVRTASSMGSRWCNSPRVNRRSGTSPMGACEGLLESRRRWALAGLYLWEPIVNERVWGLFGTASSMRMRWDNPPLVNRRCTRSDTPVTVPQAVYVVYLSSHIAEWHAAGLVGSASSMVCVQRTLPRVKRWATRRDSLQWALTALYLSEYIAE